MVRPVSCHRRRDPIILELLAIRTRQPAIEGGGECCSLCDGGAGEPCPGWYAAPVDGHRCSSAGSPPPGAPKISAIIESKGSGKARFRWEITDDSTITGYQIKQWTGSSEPADGWADVSVSGKGTITRKVDGKDIIIHTVSGLTEGVEYRFHIRAVAGSVTGTPSEVIKLTIAVSITGFKAEAGDGQVRLSWDNPGNPAITNYHFELWSEESEKARVAEIPGSNADTTSHVVRGLTNGVRYRFRIRALIGPVIGNGSLPIFATPAPGSPTGLTAVAGNSQVTLSWSNPNDVAVTGYQYKQWTGNTETNPGNWVDISGSGKNTITHTVRSLTNGVRYRFRIRAVAGSVTGVDSDFVVVTLTGAVTITGTATQGQTLTADTSGISDPDGPSSLTFTYQWKRDGSAISSATQETYTLTQADVGAAITVTVSWTDAGSTVETLISDATSNVANLNDAPTGAVTITGTVTQGQTLTADTSTISDPDGPSSLTFTYQWTRGGNPISSATGRTYTLTQADVGKAITVTVSWTDAGSTVETLISAATANVANTNDSPTGAVTITGTATQGETLTADTSTISDPDGPSSLTFTYQWKRGGSAISSATGRTYTLTQADVGAKITVTVTWTDARGTSESLTSTATANVANVNDSPTGAVTITGTATQGETLTADTSTISDPDGPSSPTFSYQWKHGGSAISSATSGTYILTQADVGKAITVTVSWTDAHGASESLTSAATSNVANVNDPPTGAVTLTGTVTQGETLTAVTSTIVDPDGPDRLTFTYQWTRGGNPISGATQATYTLTQADVGAKITVTVTWTDSGSTVETLTSDAVQVGSPLPFFGSASIEEYNWTVGEAVDVRLPAATGGDGPITYRLSPALPAGLSFEAKARTITGTPTEAVAKTRFTDTATDADGQTGQLHFRVTVQAAEVTHRSRALTVALAAFGRTAATEAVAVIGRRFGAPPVGKPAVTVGGTAVPALDVRSVAGVLGGVLGLTGASRDSAGRGRAAEGRVAPSRSPRLAATDVFARSEFAVPLTGTNEGELTTGWTFWGTGAASGFSSQLLETDGAVYTGYVGLDYRFGQKGLAGVAVSHSVGGLDYEVAGDFLLVSGERGGIRGEVDLAMTSVLPYVHYTPSPGLGLWGLAGAGVGELEVQDAAGRVETDVQLLLAAVGGRQALTTWHGIEVAVKSDAFAVRVKADEAAGLAAVTGVAHRARVALAMKTDVALSPESALQPSVELGGRWDNGDAETGMGAELSGGVEYQQRWWGVSLAARGRYLLAHQATDFEAWGGSLAVKVGEGLGGQGLWVAFEPTWGTPASGVEQLWGREAGPAGNGAPAGGAVGRLTADVGYGLALRQPGWRVTPYGGVATGPATSRYRLGGHLQVHEAMALSLEGIQQTTLDSATEHGIVFSWTVGL